MNSRRGKPDTDADLSVRAVLDGEVMPAVFVVNAGAGSGKTTSLVKALDHIRTAHATRLRAAGQRVACITYTDVAAGEIWREVGTDPLFSVATIHSFLWGIIQPFHADLTRQTLASIHDSLNRLQAEREGFSTRTRPTTRERNQQSIQRRERDLARVPEVQRWRYGTGSRYSEGILGHHDVLTIGSRMLLENPLLARLIALRFPFTMVDESQDTDPRVVEALLQAYGTNTQSGTALGFFGDPMQQIYGTGIGEIPIRPPLLPIDKPENYRSGRRIVELANAIRQGGDGRSQIPSSQNDFDGLVTAVLVDASDREAVSASRVRGWLASQFSDPGWSSTGESNDVRVLVVVHKIAARHMGFTNMFESFSGSQVPDYLSTEFLDGDLGALAPFTRVLLPLAKAVEGGHPSESMRILLANSPALREVDRLPANALPATLSRLKEAVEKLPALLEATNDHTIAAVYAHGVESGLIDPNERLEQALVDQASPAEEDDDLSALSERELQIVAAHRALLSSPAAELRPYNDYISFNSAYSTQQGIKGAECERVLVLIDDEEGRHPFFSYDRLLGLIPATRTEQGNAALGKETIVDRTRRLFYVCCTRAMRHLTLLFYTTDVESATNYLKQAGLFKDEEILHIRPEDLSTSTTPDAVCDPAS